VHLFDGAIDLSLNLTRTSHRRFRRKKKGKETNARSRAMRIVSAREQHEQRSNKRANVTFYLMMVDLRLSLRGKHLIKPSSLFGMLRFRIEFNGGGTKWLFR